MKIIMGLMAIFIYWATTQTVFAEENNAGTLYVNIGSETKAIVFDSSKTAKIDIQPDHSQKSVQLSLPPGSTEEIMLPSCNNQHIMSNQSANCPVSSSSLTILTLVDVSHFTSTQKGALIGGAAGGVVTGITAILGIVGTAITGTLILPTAIVTAGLMEGLGLGVGAAVGAGVGKAAGI